MGRRKRNTHGIIYLITNTITGKKYVGSTVQTLNDRWKQHWKDAEAGRGFAFQAAIKKYGKEQFKVEAITEVHPEHILPQLEVFYIYLHQSLYSKNGYNLTRGGDGVPCTDEMRAKMSASQTGRKHPEYVKKKISRSNSGKTLPPEQVRAMSLARLGKKHTPETCAAMSRAKMGHNPSPETRKKLSENITGYKHHMWGKHESVETKAKKSASLLAHYKTNTKPPLTASSKELMSLAKTGNPEFIANLVARNKMRAGQPSKFKGTSVSEESKAKTRTLKAENKAAKAVAKMKLMVKAHLLTLALAPKEILV